MEMDMRWMMCASLLGLTLAGCGTDAEPVSPTVLSAHHSGSPGYTIAIDSSFGGTSSRGNGISNRGWVAGWSLLEDGSRHAALWRSSIPDDLGTLGGAASRVQWPGINNSGMVVGISETDEVDPLDESRSCEAFLGGSDRVCRGFAYSDGVMRPMP